MFENSSCASVEAEGNSKTKTNITVFFFFFFHFLKYVLKDAILFSFQDKYGCCYNARKKYLT